MSKENEEVLTTTSSEGDTSFMGCKTAEENKTQKVCMDVENKNAHSSNRAKNEKGMLDNNTYNLMEQLLIENRSLWRIKNNYKTDSAIDNESKQLWNTIEKEKEELVNILSRIN